MSKELLKRALDALDDGLMGTEAISLTEDIETYLAQQEPEPVAWLIPGSITRDAGLASANGRNATPLYTSTPNQSALVAELEKHLLAALEGQKAETLLKNAAISSLEQQLAAKDARVAELKDELLAVWDKYESTGAELCAVKQQLAALQAKLDSFSDDLICAKRYRWLRDTQNSDIRDIEVSDKPGTIELLFVYEGDGCSSSPEPHELDMFIDTAMSHDTK